MSESIKDIVREMRAWTVDTDGLAPEEVSLNVSAFADRIEAAYRREFYEAESMEEIEVDRWTSSRCN